jgi:hypothetical protein
MKRILGAELALKNFAALAKDLYVPFRQLSRHRAGNFIARARMKRIA